MHKVEATEGDAGEEGKGWGIKVSIYAFRLL